MPTSFATCGASFYRLVARLAGRSRNRYSCFAARVTYRSSWRLWRKAIHGPEHASVSGSRRSWSLRHVLVGPVIAAVRPTTHARPDQSDDQDDECAVEQVFQVIIHRPDALTPLLPRKNVHKHSADRDDGNQQDCGGQNNVIHDNGPFVAVAMAQIDAGNLGFWRQSRSITPKYLCLWFMMLSGDYR